MDAVKAAHARVIHDRKDRRGIAAFAGAAGVDAAGAFGATGAFGAAGGVVADGVTGVVAGGAPGLGADSSLLINLPWGFQTVMKAQIKLLIQRFQ
jgi:hypothetical protein